MATLAYVCSWKWIAAHHKWFCFCDHHLTIEPLKHICRFGRWHRKSLKARARSFTLKHTHTHSEALFVHIWGSWLLTSAMCPLSWVIVLQTSQCNEWLRFLSAASLKLRTGARMTARARSWVNIIKSKCQFKLQPVNLRQIILHYYPVTFVLIGFTVEPRAFLSSDSITVIGRKRMWHWPQQGYAPCRACTLPLTRLCLYINVHLDERLASHWQDGWWMIDRSTDCGRVCSATTELGSCKLLKWLSWIIRPFMNIQLY